MNSWLLTWTTYGTWLPGDPRGSVTRVRESASGGSRVMQNRYGTACVVAPGLNRSAMDQMKGPPIYLTQAQAKTTIADLLISAEFRRWRLHAAAVMANHAHLVTTAGDEFTPSKLKQIYKSFASRRLNQEFGRPKSETWWTSGGSKRFLPDERALESAIEYVRNQRNPLALYIAND